MRTTRMKSQRGQAMTEFVAAMAMFIPLIMGVIYVFKYGGIKHQAVQASRYAAMERALDPHLQETDAQIRDETVARFFRDGALHVIAANDKATGATAGDENPNWGQLNGDSMLGPDYTGITLALSAKSLDSLALKPIDAFLSIPSPLNPFNGLNGGFGTEADVEVPIANVPGFSWLSNNLKIGATTVIAGDPWNGGGAANVAGHFGTGSVPARNPLTNLVKQIPGADLLFQWFADTPAPVFGCVKPDVVPDAVAPGAKYNSQDDPNSPSNPNDQCY